MTFPLLKRVLTLSAVEHLQQKRGIACDYRADQDTVYAPCGGVLQTYVGEQMGNVARIIRPNGDVIELAHLSKFLVKQKFWFKTKVTEGQPIGISGNTGRLTPTSPPYKNHLHCQIFVGGVRVDPEIYFRETSIPILAVNFTIPEMQAFQKSILDYSAGMLTISWDIINYPITILEGDLPQDESYQIVDKIFDVKYLPFRNIFIKYNSPSAAYYKSYVYPRFECAVTTAPGTDPTSLTFEFSHQLLFVYNILRGDLPFLPNDDLHTINDDLISKKLRSVLPYLKETILKYEHN